jgi:DNA-binding transcriptional ArsR family regulator
VTVDREADEPLHWSWAAILTDPVRLAVLRALSELQSATIAELRCRCHASERTVRRHLEALGALGLVLEQPGERDGLSPGRPGRRFVLDAEVGTRVSALFELLREPLVTTPPPAQLPPWVR